MAVWQNYWKIVTPASRKATYQPQTEINTDTGGGTGFSSSWFSNVLRGATTRTQSYKQFDNMDFGDVARALDIVAEEMTNPDKRTDLPFQIDYQTEENQNVSDTTVTTLRAALRQWSKMNKLNKKVFDIAREMCKYGDCFFRKTSDTEEWEHVAPDRIIGIEIDNKGKKVAYHVKPRAFGAGPTGYAREETVEIVPGAAMLHFTLSNDMGTAAPFGTSLLQSAYRDWQKLQMLEDAAIIYRIVRAPERRVFYIDVGNKPAHLVKQYLEQIKNDIRQKRIPNAQNSQQADGQFNPESVQEDYYFPVTAAGRSSRVETLTGGTTWETPELEHFLTKVFRALRVPTSYMKGADAQGAQYTDGKVGIAYIEELRFANFIQRLQVSLEEIFDEHFKTYLAVMGINLDFDLFMLKLPEPQNFALYRQAQLDADLINSFKSIEDVPYLSKRFSLKRYLGLTEEEIQMNEAMVKVERGIDNADNVSDIRQIYDSQSPSPSDAGMDQDFSPSEPMPEPEPPEPTEPPESGDAADQAPTEPPGTVAPAGAKPQPNDGPDLGILS